MSLSCGARVWSTTLSISDSGHVGFRGDSGMSPHRRRGGFDILGGGGNGQVEAAADHVLRRQQRGATGRFLVLPSSPS